MAAALDEIDPVFAAIAKAVHPDLDPQALWAIAKAMPGTSDVSTPGHAKRDKKLAVVGLGATGVAGIGGVHALKATLGEADKAKKLAHSAGTARTVPKLLRKLPVSPARAAELGTAGWVGLHGIELLGDSLGARAQMRELKQQKKTPVAKGLRRIPHVEPEALVRADARARRVGLRLIGASGVAAGAGGGYAAGRHTRLRRAAPLPTGEVAKVDLVFRGEISKIDQDKRQAFGWASVAMIDGEPVDDLQGDRISIEEIEKSAYSYMLHSRVGGGMHQRIGKGIDLGPVHIADTIESFVVTPEKLQAMGLAPDALPLAWWLGQQINDEDAWQKVKRGEWRGFSVHGTGTRRELAA